MGLGLGSGLYRVRVGVGIRVGVKVRMLTCTSAHIVPSSANVGESEICTTDPPPAFQSERKEWARSVEMASPPLPPAYTVPSDAKSGENLIVWMRQSLGREQSPPPGTFSVLLSCVKSSVERSIVNLFLS